MKDKTLAVLCYLTWVPSIYLVLTEKRRNDYLNYHARQALLLWTIIFVVFFAARMIVNSIWLIYYVPHLEVIETSVGFASFIYAAYCARRCYLGVPFTIPH
ncbi:MAG: hypothetical protein WC500_03190 [Candidatus Margulisiibacteriota bacterium]